MRTAVWREYQQQGPTGSNENPVRISGVRNRPGDITLERPGNPDLDNPPPIDWEKAQREATTLIVQLARSITIMDLNAEGQNADEIGLPRHIHPIVAKAFLKSQRKTMPHTTHQQINAKVATGQLMPSMGMFRLDPTALIALYKITNPPPMQNIFIDAVEGRNNGTIP